MDLTKPPGRNRYYLPVPPAREDSRVPASAPPAAVPPASAPPARATDVRVLAEFGEDVLRETRDWARRYFQAWGVQEELADDALLVLDELATNAIRAVRELPMPGISPSVECQLVYAGLGTDIMVTVWDSGLGEPAFYLNPVSTDHTGDGTSAVSGRGLFLARELSHGQVGWSANGRGKRVWANVGQTQAQCWTPRSTGA